MAEAILASLQRLKAIDVVQVPEENTCVGFVRARAENGNKEDAMVAEYIDTLRDLLRRETARADDLQKLHENKYTLMTGNALAHMKKRAEAAERRLAAILKLGENPSEEMLTAAYHRCGDVTWNQAKGIFEAMFAKLVEQAKEQANG